MKKMFIAIAAVVAASCTVLSEPAFEIPDISEVHDFSLYEQFLSDWSAYPTNKAVYEKYWNLQTVVELANQAAATNAAVHTGPFNNLHHLFWNIGRFIAEYDPDDTRALTDIFDGKFADSDFLWPPQWYFGWYPKCTAKWISQNPQWATNHPVATTLWSRYPKIHQNARPVPAKINMDLVECAILGECNTKGFEKRVNESIKYMVKPIKKYLREHDRSFVTDEETGVNPVQEIVDQLLACLSNPNFSGTREFLATYFPDYEWVEPKYMTSEELEQLKDDVFYGEIDMTPGVEMKLRAAMGQVEYNKFVNRYNGKPEEFTEE